MSAQYEAAAREAADKPVTFRLCEERFATKVEVDGFVVMELSKAFADAIDDANDDAEPDEEAGMRALVLWYDFFEGVLPAGEFRRFKRICRRNAVGLDQITQIGRDIMPLQFGFPTTPSSSSAELPTATGHGSTDGVATLAPVASTG